MSRSAGARDPWNSPALESKRNACSLHSFVRVVQFSASVNSASQSSANLNSANLGSASLHTPRVYTPRDYKNVSPLSWRH